MCCPNLPPPPIFLYALSLSCLPDLCRALVLCMECICCLYVYVYVYAPAWWWSVLSCPCGLGLVALSGLGRVQPLVSQLLHVAVGEDEQPVPALPGRVAGASHWQVKAPGPAPSPLPASTHALLLPFTLPVYPAVSSRPHPAVIHTHKRYSCGPLACGGRVRPAIDRHGNQLGYASARGPNPCMYTHPVLARDFSISFFLSQFTLHFLFDMPHYSECTLTRFLLALITSQFTLRNYSAPNSAMPAFTTGICY